MSPVHVGSERLFLRPYSGEGHRVEVTAIPNLNMANVNSSGEFSDMTQGLTGITKLIISPNRNSNPGFKPTSFDDRIGADSTEMAEKKIKSKSRNSEVNQSIVSPRFKEKASPSARSNAESKGQSLSPKA